MSVENNTSSNTNIETKNKKPISSCSSQEAEKVELAFLNQCYLHILDFLLVPIEIIPKEKNQSIFNVKYSNSAPIEVFLETQQLWIDNYFLSNYNKSNFYSCRVPSISLLKYIDRLIRYAPCSKECYIIGFVYLSKFYKETVFKEKAFFFNIKTIYRLFLTSILLASKFIDDKFYSNEYYAKIGGITLEELNKLEIEFLQTINFECFVSKSEYLHFCFQGLFELPKDAYFLEWTDQSKSIDNHYRQAEAQQEDQYQYDSSSYYDVSLISTLNSKKNTTSSLSPPSSSVTALSTIKSSTFSSGSDYSNSDFTDEDNISPRNLTSNYSINSSPSISPRVYPSNNVPLLLNSKNSYLFQIKMKNSLAISMRAKKNRIESFLFINKRTGSSNLFKIQTKGDFYKKHGKFLESLLKLNISPEN